ncbi:MAG: PIN domain-containing protein [Nitrospirae bacterium]|nr:PIN domain-containing protein [Nitrospirota bacterium]
MTIEATTTLQIDSKAAIRHLKNHPLDVKKLTQHLVVPKKGQASGINSLPVDMEDVLHSAEIKKEYGLLTNDAINLAIMRRHHLKTIASNDPDFERVPDLTVWKPI